MIGMPLMVTVRSEEDVPAPPSAIRLAGGVEVVEERDLRLAGLDVTQLVE